MRVFVKLLPFPDGLGKILAIYRHPVRERATYRFLTSLDSALEYKREAERRLSTDLALEEMRIEQLLLLFQEERPDSPLLRHRKIFATEFLETFGDTHPRDVGKAAIEAWITRYAKERNHQADTITSDKVFLNYFFRFLVEKGLIEKTPITGIKSGHGKRRSLSSEEIDTILSEAKRLSPGHLYPMALLAQEANASPEEIYALRWKYVDLAGGRIVFERAGYRAVHKMSPELLTAISSIAQESLYVFVSQEGRPLDGATMNRTRGQFRKHSAFRENWTLDDLRPAP